MRPNASRRFSRRSQPWPSSSYQCTSWNLPSISSASTIRSVIKRDDPRVLAPVQDQQRGLDPLGAVDRGSSAVQLGLRRVVRRAHHALELEPPEAVTVAEALGDLRVAKQVDAGPPHRRLLDERRQHQVPAVRATEDGQPPIRPRLLGRPSCCIDDIVDVRVAPFPVVGPAGTRARSRSSRDSRRRGTRTPRARGGA